MPVLEETADDSTTGVLALEDLVAACRRAEPDAFRELFELYKDRVYSVALRYSGDAVLAQDIAQETFVKLFAAIGSFRGEASFESWLYRLVVNCCFDHKRKERRFLPLVDSFLSALRSPAGSALDEAVRSERSGRLQTVLSELPPEQRMIIVLRYSQGLTYEEIGEIMGCSPGTVGSRLNRLHKQLETRLTRAEKKRGLNKGNCLV